MVNKVQSVVLIQSNDELGVRMAPELVVEFREKVFADPVIVVELAIHYRVDCVLCIVERLSPVR